MIKTAGNREQRIEDLFQAAVKLAEPQREAFLREQCDDEARAEVKKLLDFDQVKGGGLTAEPAADLMPTQDSPISPKRDGQPKSPSSATTGSINHGRFLPGTVLSERYRMVGMLGKGGMGEVYRADDLELGQSVALKFLPQRLADEPKSLERFRAEVRLARQVSHPNVCRVYDIGQLDGQYFLSMEYVDGEDLAQLLTRIGRFNQERATELARQLCLGLYAAHENGVLHRDLKPANIMIDGRGKLLITDFGLAELADKVPGVDVRSGTPTYMSPEQLAGREVTQRSDVYSLGIILHELYTGKTVWEASSMAELVEKRQSDSPVNPSTYLPEIDPQIERVIQRCLEPAAENRPPSAIAVMGGLPGGDPLAAALAAGDTPSPRMVADSGDDGRLRKPVGIGLFLIACLMLLAVPAISDRWGKLDFGALKEREPAVLHEKSKQIIQSLGYDIEPYQASGFDVDEHGRLEYWYRQSPCKLTISTPLLPGVGAAWQPTINDPPPFRPGMVTLRLDSNGRLAELLACVDPTESQHTDSQDLNWEAWLAVCDIDLAYFEPTEPDTSPPVVTSHVRAWKSDDNVSEIVAGASHGRLSYLARLDSSSSPAIASRSVAKPKNTLAVAIIFIAVCVLAKRNLAQGRADYRSALLVAVFVIVAGLLNWFSMQPKWYAFDLDTFANYFLRCFGKGARGAVYYVALEPLVRRYWPGMLITWSRLTTGRVRDPKIGQHVLFGVISGVASWCIYSTTGGFNINTRADIPGWANALVHNSPFSAVFSCLEAAIVDSIFFVAVLVWFRVLTRNTTISAALFVLVILALRNMGHFQAPLVLGITLHGIILVLMATRFGLLACMTNYFVCSALSAIPFASDLHAWYANVGITGIAVMLLIAFYGLYSSTLAPESDPFRTPAILRPS